MTPRSGGLAGCRVEPVTEMGTGQGGKAAGYVVLVPSEVVRLKV